ncbi:MAG: hypothetical protein WC617_16685 [Rhodanobacter sp.]|jgi:Ca-activated chloride channel family protein
MKLITLLRSLLLALLVMLTGCSTPKPALDTQTAENTSATQPQVPIAPPANRPVEARQTSPLVDQAVNETAASIAMPAPPAPLAGATSRKALAQAARSYPGAPMMMPIRQPLPGDVNRENYTHRDSNRCNGSASTRFPPSALMSTPARIPTCAAC